MKLDFFMKIDSVFDRKFCFDIQFSYENSSKLKCVLAMFLTISKHRIKIGFIKHFTQMKFLGSIEGKAGQ